jgi:anti-anti-sigma factor
LDGEVDITSVDHLRNAIYAAMSLTEGPIALDCAGVTYIGAAGLGTLVWFANQARDQKRAATLVDVSRAAQRLLDLTGIGHLFEPEMLLDTA